MSTPASSDVPIRRIDRILAFMSLGIALLSIICFFAIIIGTGTGMEQGDFATGIWPMVAAIPLFGLPIAFLLIIALLIMSFVRRARAAKNA
ncbi:MAG TPA: multidrug ABC transporter ATPase [Microbacterium sp.]|nr:multidrug ABC transporter ATPase [Microbacterium sp.]